jgi:DNA-directed RNA polymerase subunit F
MAEMPPIVVELQAKTDQLKSGLSQAEGQLKQFGSTAEAQGSHVESLGGKLKELGKAAFELFAIKEAIQFIGEAGKKAAENASSFATMSNTLKNVTGATKEQTDAIDKQLEAMALQSGHITSDLRPAFSQLVQVTGDSSKSLQLLSLAQDVAASKHKDLSTVSAAFSKYLAGNSAALNKLAPETKGAADAFGVLAKESQGAAKAAADADPYKKLQATFTTIQEKLGKGVLPLISSLGDVLISVMPAVDPLAKLIGDVVAAVAPLITQLVEGLVPIIQTLAPAISTIVGAFAPLISQILEALMPVLNSLAGLIADIVQKFIPPMARILGEVLVPIIKMLADWITGFLIPAWDKLVQVLGPVYDWISKQIVNAFKQLMKFLGPLWENILRPMIEGLAKLLGIKVNFNVSTTTDKATKDLFGGDASAFDFSGLTTDKNVTSSTSQSAADKHKAAVKTFTAAMTEAATKAKAAQVEYTNKVADAYAEYANKTADITDAFNAAMDDATAKRDADMEALAKDHSANLLSIQQDFAAKLNDIVQQSMDELRSTFASASKMDIGSMFASSFSGSNSLSSTLSTQVKDGLTSVVAWWGSSSGGSGGGVAGLLKTMQDKLAASKMLSDNAAALAGAGFSQNFINQVLAQGTDVGNTMASAILKSAPETQKALQSTFTEAESVTNHGVDTLAKNLYATQGLASESLKDLYAKTLEDQAAALETENENFLTAQGKITDTFNKAVDKATEARDKALAAANEALQKALGAAEAALDKTLTAIQAKIDATIAKMGNLNPSAAAGAKTAVDNAKALSMTPTTIGVTSMSGAVTSGQTSWMSGMFGNSPTINVTTNSNASAEDIATAAANAIKLGLVVGVGAGGSVIGL